MDPCCGSGHFLTSLFEMLWRMRVEEEGLDPVTAQDSVLAENLFGLELDPRCTQIAAFNVALAAWKAGGYRQLPELNIACSGIRVAGSRDSWLELAGSDPRLRDGLERLHEVFKDADTLGSLIDPRRAVGDDSLLAAGWDEIEPLLHQALASEKTDDPAAAVFGQQVAAVAKAASLLSRRRTLVATNPPWLVRGRFDPIVRSHVESAFDRSSGDLATAFLDRYLATSAAVCAVLPQNWLSIRTFQRLREGLLGEGALDLIAVLGSGAFESITGEVVQPVLTHASGKPLEMEHFDGIDVSVGARPREKAGLLQGGALFVLSRVVQLGNHQARIVLGEIPDGPRIGERMRSLKGITTGDDPHFRRAVWELPTAGSWVRLQSAPSGERPWSGCSDLVHLDYLDNEPGAYVRGSAAWGEPGVAIGLMSNLPVGLYLGTPFDTNIAVLLPTSDDLAALWAFTKSSKFPPLVRIFDRKLSIQPGTLGGIPFDVESWRGRAAAEFPDGLPEPWSDDPTQWLFLGDPAVSTDPLQVGVARLLGYSWPDQEPDSLDRVADADGIVCLPSVMGEAPAADRLRELLVAAFDADSDPVGLVDGLLADADAEGKGLGWWLENRFFKQHHQLFHKRPFIWHITDHHRDGFSALVNYHQLDRAGLERLTFTYLGWWIDAQRAEVAGDVAGADDRLAAAEDLQDKLRLILEGEPPYDIYVRWKTLAEQSIGWNPDLDDGVRLNIRPFVEAGVLKIKKPSGIKWGKDRGKNPDGSERFNDLHFTREEKQIARDDQ